MIRLLIFPFFLQKDTAVGTTAIGTITRADHTWDKLGTLKMAAADEASVTVVSVSP